MFAAVFGVFIINKIVLVRLFQGVLWLHHRPKSFRLGRLSNCCLRQAVDALVFAFDLAFSLTSLKKYSFALRIPCNFQILTIKAAPSTPR